MHPGGMMAGALEIATLWPMEWAKVQMQLVKPSLDH